jgi:hypothetical protein
MSHWKGIVGTGFTPEQFDTYVQQLHFGIWRPQFVVLHNTANPRISGWHSVPGEQRMTNLAHYYRDTQKWSAGPHLFVADDLIWVFTPLITSGVHSPSWNRISWGVEMVGHYGVEAFDKGLGRKVKDNTIEALVTLHAVMGIDSHTLRFHKEDPLTDHDCPGKFVKKEDIIQRVHDRLVERYAGDHRSDRPG